MRFSKTGHLQVQDRVLVMVVLVVTMLVYLPTLMFPFAADDASQILGNPHVHSWRYIPQYFQTHVWGHLSMGNGDRAAAYYRPMFLCWELASWMVFGASTLGWHLSGVALHLLATALVYFAARYLTENSTTAFVTALLFGVHPIHVEGVTWVSGATEPLAAIPFLAGLLCWIRAYESRRALLWRAGAVAFYALALLAKETTIMFPVVLLAYELVVRRERAGRERAVMLRRMAPYLLITLLYLAVRQIALKGTAHNPVPLNVLLLTWPSVLWLYLSHALLPVKLSLLYDVSLLTQFSWREVGIPAVLVAVTGVLVIWWTRENRMARFAAVWALVVLLPPLYLPAFSPVEIAHDRYLYLPSIGLCLLLALVLGRLPSRMFLPATAGLALVFSSLTVLESRPWSHEVSLFSRAVQVASHSWHAKRQLAFALERNGQCDIAMPLLAAIVDSTPDDHVAVFAMGACNFHKGEFAETERLMRRVIALYPAYQQPYLLLATIFVGKRRIDEAEEQWRQSRAVQVGAYPEPSFHLVRAEILMARNDFRGAIAEYKKELELQPGNPEITAALTRAEEAALKTGVSGTP